MKGTLVFNISMDRKSNVSTDTDTSLGIAWEGFDIAPIKTYECDPDCVHHFIIPTGAKRVIGQCSKCKGERWFNNYIDMQFNRTPKTTEQIQAETDAKTEQENSNEKV